MKKRLVFIITFVIIQLFYFTLHSIEVAAEETQHLNVSEVVVRGADTYSPSWILRQVGISDYSSLKSYEILQRKAFEIEDLYKKRGFYFVTCDYAIEHVSENDEVQAAFKIKEGQRVIIEKVDFKGNFFVKKSKLREIIQTKPSGFFVKNFLRDEAISHDKEAIEKYYNRKGISAVVNQVEKVFNHDSNTVSITFFLQEKSLTGKFKNRTAQTVLEQFTMIQKELHALQKEVFDYKNENSQLQKELRQKKDKLNDLEHDRRNDISRLEEIKNEEISRFKDRMAEINEENKHLQEKTALQEKRLSEKDEVEDMLTSYLAQERLKTKEKLAEVEKLNQEIETLSQEKNKIEEKLHQARQDIKKEQKEKDLLKEKMANFTEMIKDRIAEIDKVNTQLAVVLDQTRHAINKELDSIELSTVVISGGEEPRIIMKQEDGKKIFIQKVKPTEDEDKLSGGKVLIVNRKLNFIVINFGKEHGVKESMIFGVFHEDELVANIRVIETRDQISAAEIVFLKEDMEIQEGDGVSRIDNS